MTSHGHLEYICLLFSHPGIPMRVHVQYPNQIHLNRISIHCFWWYWMNKLPVHWALFKKRKIQKIRLIKCGIAMSLYLFYKWRDASKNEMCAKWKILLWIIYLGYVLKVQNIEMLLCVLTQEIVSCSFNNNCCTV